MSTPEERSAAIDRGVAARNAAIDQGVAARNAAIDRGLAERQERLRPQPERVQRALSGFFGSLDGASAGSGASAPRAAPAVITGPGASARAPGVEASTGNGPGPLPTWPKAFRAMAQKINELCQWWGGLTAGPGVAITKSRGRTIISLRSGHTGSPAAVATELHYNDGTTQIDIDENGIQLTQISSGIIGRINIDGSIEYTEGAGANRVIMNADGFQVRNANGGDPKFLEITYSELTQDMGIVELPYCDGGVERKILVIASAPYD